MEKRPQIFLSYAREDEEKVSELYRRLVEAGFRPWMDVEDIVPGERWRFKVEQAMRESDFIVVCLSENSLTKRGFVRREIRAALDACQEKLDSDIYLIPVRLDDCPMTDPQLREFQWLEWFKPNGYDLLVKAVREGLRRTGWAEPSKPAVIESEPLRRAPVEPGIVVPRTPDLRQPPEGITIATPDNLKDLLSMPEPPKRLWWEKAEMELCLVPAGEFLMGSADSDEDADGDEKPQHEVYLDAYYIGRYPVTNAQYALFLEQTGHRAPPEWDEKQKKTYHPVVYVSWKDAGAYCKWAGLRLPTEAEWEKAARGDDGRIYPWGSEWDARKCNTGEGGKGDTTPVGAYSLAGDSPYGCADMAGNVWEWAADWYDGGYYRVSPQRNPKGSESGSHRVLRGGSWSSNRSRARSAYRGRHIPVYLINYRGFRVCLSFTFSL